MSNSKHELKIAHRMEMGDGAINVRSDGLFEFNLDGMCIRRFHSLASVADGRRLNTRTALCTGIHEEDVDTPWGIGKRLCVNYEEEGLCLEQRLTLISGKRELVASVVLHDNMRITETNFLAPLDNPYPEADERPLFRSLDQRMLLAPYDNDMWTRWEATPLRPGRTSYDVTALFDEISRNGLVIGALDHDVWKNAISCSAWDARSVIAYSGVADASTHDSIPHGTVIGEYVESARFMVGWYDDIRDGMETFADFCVDVRSPLPWDMSVPFGWNSFSGIGRTTLESWEAAADFMQELPEFCNEDGSVYANLDAAFGLDADKRRALVKHFHSRGQKCGTYGGPFLFHKMLENQVIPSSGGVRFKDIVLKDASGRILPAVDGMHALDCTHPAWENYARGIVRNAAEEGFDYLKIDFLSHGALEGVHSDADIRTGRQAYTYGMKIIVDELSRASHTMFLSLSIAPIFPYGYGHARRCCCDSFGHTEDVRYVLNALNFGWWTNRKLYALNDPDHIALYNSVIDGRGPTLFSEARSRYNSAVISGTVMLLSDNYGPDGDSRLIAESKMRAKKLATNAKLNALARSKVAFRPVELSADTAEAYTAHIAGKDYVAVFNFKRQPVCVSLDYKRGAIPDSGYAVDLNRNIGWNYDHTLNVALEPMDSTILEIQVRNAFGCHKNG